MGWKPQLTTFLAVTVPRFVAKMNYELVLAISINVVLTVWLEKRRTF